MKVNTIIEKKVLDFRKKYGLTGSEKIHLQSFLQGLGVVTLFKPLSNGLSGMAVKVQGNGEEIHRFMLINSTHTLGRQHFTICHELYHLFVQENFTFKACATGLFDAKKDREEYNADVFAAYLLMPHDGILSLIDWDELEKDTLSLETVVKLEQHFSCSRSALVFRLQEIGFISKEYAERLKLTPRKDAINYGFDTHLYEPGNENRHLGDYGVLARELYDKELISESHYYALMEDLGVKFDENE